LKVSAGAAGAEELLLWEELSEDEPELLAAAPELPVPAGLLPPQAAMQKIIAMIMTIAVTFFMSCFSFLILALWDTRKGLCPSGKAL
jgi:hypothetical protein